MKFVAKYGNWKIFHNDHEVFQNSEMRKFDIIARNSPVKIAEQTFFASRLEDNLMMTKRAKFSREKVIEC